MKRHKGPWPTKEQLAAMEPYRRQQYVRMEKSRHPDYVKHRRMTFEHNRTAVEHAATSAAPPASAEPIRAAPAAPDARGDRLARGRRGPIARERLVQSGGA